MNVRYATTVSETIPQWVHDDDGARLFDHSITVFEFSGKDRAQFLHSQVTNDVKNAPIGAFLEATMPTPMGRCEDLCSIIVRDDRILLLASCDTRAALMMRMDKYIFPLDDVHANDVTDSIAACVLVGPGAESSLNDAANEQTIPTSSSAVAHWKIEEDGDCITVARSTGLKLPGFTIIGPKETISLYSQKLLSSRKVLRGTPDEWEKLRITQGRPAYARELTDDYTVLEAGLYHTVHFNKGCYIGQESIAKVGLRNALRSQLWGVIFDGVVAEGAELTLEDTPTTAIGIVTSALPLHDALGTNVGTLGLAYVKRSAVRLSKKGLSREEQSSAAGLRVRAGVSSGTLRELPYQSRSLSEAAAAPTKEKEEKPVKTNEDEEAARKAAKLVEMQARLTAFQKKKGAEVPTQEEPPVKSAEEIEEARKAAKLVEMQARLTAFQKKNRAEK